MNKDNEEFNEKQLLNLNSESFDENIVVRDEAIKKGNAYHEALKVIDFDKIKSREDLENNKYLLKERIGEEYFNLIDLDLLFKNISIIKSIIKNGRVFKEKQFIMKTNLKEVGISESENEIIVQGICDLFSIGEENILIDYKFTSEKNVEKIKERYSKQIYLYSLAIEKGFDVKIDKKFLLSLKYGKVIEI